MHAFKMCNVDEKAGGQTSTFMMRSIHSRARKQSECLGTIFSSELPKWCYREEIISIIHDFLREAQIKSSYVHIFSMMR